MPYSENDPAKRNLTLTSLCFIVFCGAQGTFGAVDGKAQVTLGVINATFQNHSFLIATAWALLLWFGYQYWLTRTDGIWQIYKGNLITYFRNNQNLCNEEIASRIGYEFNPSDGSIGFQSADPRFDFTPTGWRLYYKLVRADHAGEDRKSVV